MSLLPGVQTHGVVSGAPLAPVDHPDEHGLVPGQSVQWAPRVPLVRSEQLTLCVDHQMSPDKHHSRPRESAAVILIQSNASCSQRRL